MGRLCKKDRELLVSDLCSRVPYGVMVLERREQGSVTIPILDCGVFYILAHPDKVKPYLRSAHTITEDEIGKLSNILNVGESGVNRISIDDSTGIKLCLPTESATERLAEACRYLDSIHIDHRGLIPKKLAIEAPDNMYKPK